MTKWGGDCSKMKPVPTPFLDETQIPEEDHTQVKGKLAESASRVLMKVLYCARMARYDLLRATCGLAAQVTKWTPSCDRKLHRLMAYIKSTCTTE